MRPAPLLASLLVVSAVAAACEHPRERAAIEPALTSRVAASSFALPTPARARLFEALRVNEGCVGCHQDVAASWQGSLHQRAAIEPAYTKSFAIEPIPFCRSCHAPEADPMLEAPAALAELGVGCVTCHVTNTDGVLAAPRATESARPAPHGIVRSAAFAGADACAGCHEFRFPGARGNAPSSFMQMTVSEHAASPARARSCADCHMPRDGEGKRSHTFVASRDAGFLSRSLRVEAARLDAGRVRVRLEPIDPGHAFPTGDLFRRLEVFAEARGPESSSLGSAVRYLGRHWGFRPLNNGRELRSDDRLFDRAAEVVLDVGEPGRGREILWRVAYQRVAHPKGDDEAKAEIDGEIILASGALGPDAAEN